MEEAEASKVAAEEEAEAIKAEVPQVEDTKPEVHHLVKIIRIINSRTNITMVHQHQSTLISKAMPHQHIQPKLHQVDTGTIISIIRTEIIIRPELLQKTFTSAMSSIRPTQSCSHIALRALELHTAEE